MRLIYIILLGLLLSFVALFTIASSKEGGDNNAITMYFIVFLVPVVLVAVFNGIYIASLANLQKRSKKIIFSFIPLLLLIILSQLKNMQLFFFDGRFSFVGIVGAIGIGITNMVWLLSLFRNDQ